VCVAPFLVEVLLPVWTPPVLRFVCVTPPVLRLVVESPPFLVVLVVVGAAVTEAEFESPVAVAAGVLEDAVDGACQCRPWKTEVTASAWYSVHESSRTTSVSTSGSHLGHDKAVASGDRESAMVASRPTDGLIVGLGWMKRTLER
jgi:hypothetical protein